MLFSIGDLITLVAVLLILVVFRALDRNNRSLEKLKRFSGKIMENLSAFVEEKTGAIRDLSLELQASLKTGREILKRSRDVEEALQGRAGDIESIQKRLTEYDRVLAELAGMSDRVEQNLEKVRRESDFVETVGKKIREAAGQMERLEKRIPALEGEFAAAGKKALGEARVELLGGIDRAVGAMRESVGESDSKVRDFAAYIARLESRTEQMEKERVAALTRTLDGFDTELRAKLSRAVLSAESLEGEVFEKLAGRIQSDEAAVAKSIESLESRIADYEGEIDYRFRTLQEASGDVDCLGASLTASVEKAAAAAKAEMKGLADELVANWKVEVTGAAAAKEEISAGLSEVTAGLAELKQKSYQSVSARLAVFEDEFFSDLRARSAGVQEKFQAWQADMDRRTAEFESDVKERVSTSEESLQGLREGLRAEIVRARRDAAASFEKEILGVRDSLETGTRRMQREIEVGLKELASGLDSGRRDLAELFDASRAEIAGWEARGKEKLAQADASMAERISSLSAEAAASMASIRDAFAAQTEELVVGSNEERMSLRAELKGMGERIAGFDAELKKATEAARERFRADAEAFQLESQKRMRDLHAEVEGRIRDYRQLLADNREKAEAMQEKMSARIEEGSRLLAASLGEIDKRVKNFMSQTKIFERADTLKASLDGTIDEMKKEMAKLAAERAEIGDIEVQLARTRKLADEVSGKLTRFLAEKRRIEEMDGDFKKIVSLSREVDLKLDTLTASNDALQQIQARVRQFEEMGKAVETGFERLEKKKEILTVTSEAVDRNFQRLEGLEKTLETTDRDLDALALKVQSMRGDFDLLGANKKDADSAMETVGKLSAILSELEGRMDKAQSAREWLARTETRFQEVAQQAQEQVRLLESIVKAETKKEKTDRGAPPLDKRETVIKLSHQGWSVQEISRVTQLSRGEVELILELAPKI